jgi:hypothetical protein|eukprot:CAMPEP_0174286676 /NCGR_PEP_ID=MMETSP0809-20121228/12748_1 /TAXON_ID=73025 ORGANISM="Eutreptiella gymnastica-like, Strain CCMP1594" /NCGR_SAMPLE_ID=MMETSP0809 /ASSEMBLY_ACC=CAM_ASM_000658 /LENGTH=100 /DNA_ID=CAMNT_0015382839 /DNA_START=38 /DNA_END=340 /DNA_ORIENTATION=+
MPRQYAKSMVDDNKDGNAMRGIMGGSANPTPASKPSGPKEPTSVAKAVGDWGKDDATLTAKPTNNALIGSGTKGATQDAYNASRAGAQAAKARNQGGGLW